MRNWFRELRFRWPPENSTESRLSPQRSAYSILLLIDYKPLPAEQQRLKLLKIFYAALLSPCLTAYQKFRRTPPPMLKLLRFAEPSTVTGPPRMPWLARVDRLIERVKYW